MNSAADLQGERHGREGRPVPGPRAGSRRQRPETGVAAAAPPTAYGPSGAASRRRRGTRPVVLILDDIGAEHFHGLACTLRRRGISTIKIANAPASQPSSPGAPPRVLRSLRDWLMYDARTTAKRVRGCASLQDAVRAQRVVDVLASETTLASMLSSTPAISAVAGDGLAFAGLPPHLVTDKFEVNALLERSGVRIPPQHRVGDLRPAEAARTLGLPLVVKACVGVGGMRVRIARSVEQVEEAVAELADEAGRGAFYQRYVDGRMVMYCSVTGANGPLIEHGVMVTHAQGEVGPSARVRLYDDPELLAAGRLAVRALGCRGFSELGFLQDADGALWHVDANCRSWGNMLSLLCMGIDFTEAYRALVLGLPYAPRPGPDSASEVAVLPFSLYRAASHGPLRKIGAYVWPFATMCWRGPGLRYGGPVAAKVGLLLVHRLINAARRAIREATPLFG